MKAIIIASLAIMLFWHSVARSEMGTTVITHGFLLDFGEDAGLGDSWMLDMAYALSARKKAKVSIYELAAGAIIRLPEDKQPNTQALYRDEYNILIFDWIQESDHLCEGYSEAAGDALSALLILGVLEKKWSLDDLHFIGHSRGTVVNSEAIQRLLYFASKNMLPVDVSLDKDIRMTTLDPHPAGHWLGIADHINDDRVNYFTKDVLCPSLISGFDSKQSKCGVAVWRGGEHKVTYADNYFQSEHSGIIKGWKNYMFIGLKDYEGLSSDYFANNNLTNLKNIGHSKIHDWYHYTIDKECNDSDCKEAIKDGWYEARKRESTGYNIPIKLIKTSGIIDVTLDKTLLDSLYIFNGDMKYYCPKPTPKIGVYRPGWYFQGGGGSGKAQKNGITLSEYGVSKTHNVMYFPANKRFVSFNYSLIEYVNLQGPGSLYLVGGHLKVYYLDNKEGSKRIMLGEFPLTQDNGNGIGFVDLKDISDGGKSGHVGRIEFEVSSFDNEESGARLGLLPMIPRVLLNDIELVDGGSKTGISLILDRSSSMKERENIQDETSGIKIDRAKQAMNAYIKNMADSDNVSISTFSNKGETPLPMSKVGIAESTLSQTLAKILPAGSTNIGGGLSKGFEELEKSIGGQHMAILLSDGKNNVPGWDDVVTKYKNRKWPICTLGFGKDADEVTLTKIATETGCVYKYAESIDLINSFQELSAYAQNKSIILSARDLLPEKEKLDYVFQVAENADFFNVYTSWRGSKLSTKLINPSGSMLTDAEVRDSGGRYEEGKTFQMLEIKDPASGTWNIEVSWVEAPPVPEQVNISIAEKSDVFAWLNGFRPMYSINEPVTINVNAANVVNNKKVPLIGGTVTAEVIKPGADVVRMVQAQSTQWTMFKDVLNDNTREVTLYDDGNHNDYKAGDGIFGGIFRETDKNGAYLVNATILGQKQNGDPVEKLITGSFQVGPITNNPVTSSQSLRYTREARRHFQRPNPTLQQLENTIPLDGIEQMENSGDPLDSIDQLDGGDPLESIDSLMRSGG